MSLEPCNRVARLKNLERPSQRCAAARVMKAQFAGVETSMGDIATSATRDAYLVEETSGFFQNRDLSPLFRRGDGGEKAGSTAASHDDFA